MSFCCFFLDLKRRGEVGVDVWTFKVDIRLIGDANLHNHDVLCLLIATRRLLRLGCNYRISHF